MTLSIDVAGLVLTEEEQEAQRRFEPGTLRLGDDVLLDGMRKRANASRLGMHMWKLHGCVSDMRNDLDNISEIINRYGDPTTRKSGLRGLKDHWKILVETGEALIRHYEEGE